MIRLKWVGIDFGQTLCVATDERTFWMIGDTCKYMGIPEQAEICCLRWRILKEKYGTFPAIKESHRDEIVSYVFAGNPGTTQAFSKMEQKYLKIASGAVEALKYLREQGIAVSIVAELKRTLGPIGTDQVSLFLKNQKVIDLFDKLITPQGAVDLRDGSLDVRYKGLSKENGTIYDLLIKDLAMQGIKPDEAVMVGDKESTDLTPAQQRGLKAIQYTGFVFLAPSRADFVINNFLELKNIITGAAS
jgi:FMN phosphatase YigB (HAD superfamily)